MNEPHPLLSALCKARRVDSQNPFQSGAGLISKATEVASREDIGSPGRRTPNLGSAVWRRDGDDQCGGCGERKMVKVMPLIEGIGAYSGICI